MLSTSNITAWMRNFFSPHCNKKTYRILKIFLTFHGLGYNVTLKEKITMNV